MAALTKKVRDELKAKLLTDQEYLKKQIHDLRSEDPFLDPDHASDNAAVDTDVREKMGHETIEAQILSLSRKLDAVKYALAKVSKSAYGICERCKKPIALARLQLLPESRFCIDCERASKK